MNRKRTPSEEAVLTVVRAACLIALLGVILMGALAWAGKPIPDQLDRLVQLAAVGALALLGRTTDTKAEAKDAVEKAVNDLTELAPVAPAPAPTPVTIAGQEGVLEVTETPPEPAPSGRARRSG